MKLPLTPLIALTLAVALVVTGQYAEARKDERAAKRDYVYQLCNDARQELSGASEEACGQAQDSTNTEFLCEANNMSPSTYCWVEWK